jgi:flagellar protein FlaG
MDVSAANRIAHNVPTNAATITPDAAEQNREVVQAVKALNQTEMFGQENELQFQLDPATRRMVVRVVDRKTKEVISQAPPEYVLRLAEDLKKTLQGS